MTSRYVYKTSFSDGTYYIGVRKVPAGTDPTQDSYLGSGKGVKKKIAEGDASASKEIIASGLSHDEAYNLERVLVSREALLDPRCLNLVLGGRGGYLETVPQPRRWQRDLTKLAAAIEKTAAARRGKTKLNDAGLQRMANRLTGRSKHEHEHLKQVSMKLTGRTKHTHPRLAQAADKLRSISSERTKLTCAGRRSQSLKMTGKKNHAAVTATEKLTAIKHLQDPPTEVLLKRYSQETQKKAFDLLKAGEERWQVAALTGIALSTLNAWVARMIRHCKNLRDYQFLV